MRRSQVLDRLPRLFCFITPHSRYNYEHMTCLDTKSRQESLISATHMNTEREAWMIISTILVQLTKRSWYREFRYSRPYILLLFKDVHVLVVSRLLFQVGVQVQQLMLKYQPVRLFLEIVRQHPGCKNARDHVGGYITVTGYVRAYQIIGVAWPEYWFLHLYTFQV